MYIFKFEPTAENWSCLKNTTAHLVVDYFETISFKITFSQEVGMHVEPPGLSTGEKNKENKDGDCLKYGLEKAS